MLEILYWFTLHFVHYPHTKAPKLDVFGLSNTVCLHDYLPLSSGLPHRQRQIITDANSNRMLTSQVNVCWSVLKQCTHKNRNAS